MKNYIYTALFVLLGTGTSFSAQHLSQKKQDQADSLFSKGVQLQEAGKLEESLAFFSKSIHHYTREKDFKKAGDGYSYLAISYSLQGNYHQSLSYFEKSIETYKKVNYQVGISSVTNNMGGTYYYLGNYPQALYSYQKVLSLQKEIKDERTIAITTQNIGGIYSQLEDYKNALDYYHKAYLVYKKLKDVKAIARNLNSTGSILVKLKDFEKGNAYLNKALDIALQEDDKQIKMEVLNNLGTLFFQKADYQKAMDYFNTTLALANEMNSNQYIGEAHIAIGNIFRVKLQTSLALQNCQVGLNIAQKISSISLQKEACDCLYLSYKNIGNYKTALQFLEKSHLFEDQMASKETANRMMNMEFQKQQLTDSIAYVKKEHAIQLKHKEVVQNKEKQRNAIIVSSGFLILFAFGLWNRLNFVKKSKKELQQEKERSEKLLLNILPEEIAHELKEKGAVNARDFNLVTVLFSDFKSFTQTAEQMTPQELVEEINVCFKAFDLISEKYKIEKIKTIGDSYMAAGGIPIPEENFIANTVCAALEMQEFMELRQIENRLEGKPAFEMRIGIHAGPIVAGIVGIKKFQYDVWGDTVNTASRIESNGSVGRVNISETLYRLLKDNDAFRFSYRGNIHAKGKGNINMYYVDKKREVLQSLPIAIKEEV